MLYTNIGLKKPELTDAADIRAAVGDNMDILDNMIIPYAGTTTNVGNLYAISNPVIGTLNAGMAVSFMVNVNSTGTASLNWDGTGDIVIMKPNGTAVTNLKANGIYTVRYNGTNFILQGSDSAGDATTGDVLAGKTFSNDIDSGLTGTLSLTGTAAVGNVLSGSTFYATDAKSKLTGTMTNRGAVNITPSATNQAIVAGYHNGSGIVYGDADLVAGNIKNGVNIFGVTGNYVAKRYATGTVANPSVDVDGFDYVAASGLAFTPSIIIVEFYYADEDYGDALSGYYNGTWQHLAGTPYSYVAINHGPLTSDTITTGAFSKVLGSADTSTATWIAIE